MYRLHIKKIKTYEDLNETEKVYFEGQRNRLFPKFLYREYYATKHEAVKRRMELREIFPQLIIEIEKISSHRISIRKEKIAISELTNLLINKVEK